MKKKILLIGSNGFIGKNLYNNLKKYYLIYEINRKIKKKNKRKYYCDITKFQKLKKIISILPKLDYVINLSGQGQENRSQMYNNIYIGNSNLIKCFEKTKTIKVFFSTTMVYGNSDKYRSINSELKPNSNYAKIKLKTEILYKKISKNFLILRVGNVYDDKLEKKGFFKNLTKAIQKSTTLKVNNLNSIRNYIHVDDLGNIIKKIFDKNTIDKTLNIGHQNISNKKIIKIFEKMFQKKINIKNLNKSYNLDPNIKINPNFILKSLNYKFKNNIKSVIRQISEK